MPYMNASERDEVRHLISLMKDPRYWREQDPELLRTVRVGLRRIYRGEMGGDPGLALIDNERGEEGRPAFGAG